MIEWNINKESKLFSLCRYANCLTNLSKRRKSNIYHGDIGSAHDEAGKRAFREGNYLLASHHFNLADKHYKKC